MAESKVESIAGVVDAPEKAEVSDKNSINKENAKLSEKEPQELKVKAADNSVNDDQPISTDRVTVNCKKADEVPAAAETANDENEKHSPTDSKDDVEAKGDSCENETEEKQVPEVTKDSEPPQDNTTTVEENEGAKDSAERETPNNEEKLETENVNTDDDKKLEVALEKANNQSETETKDEVTEPTEDEVNEKNITTNIEKNVPMEVESVSVSKESDTKGVTERTDFSSEVGIAGPPMAVSDLMDEEELRAETTLPGDQKVQDHVAEWVVNSAKVEELGSVEEGENSVQEEDEAKKLNKERKPRKKKTNDVILPTRKSQRIVSNIIKKSIKCLNKMHAMEGAAGNGKKVDSAEKARDEDSSRASPKVPQSQQNGAALPEETAAAPANVECLRSAAIKKEPLCDLESELPTKNLSTVETSQSKHGSTRSSKSGSDGTGASGRKRKSTDGQLSSNGSTAPKKFCLEQREQYISSLVGSEKVTADELAARADQLRVEVQALDELARAKEMEWNEILSMRKLKEEAYLRIERRRQVMGFMEGNGQLVETLPPASLALGPDWDGSGSNTASVSKEKCNFGSKEDLREENSQDAPPTFKKEKPSKQTAHRQTPPKQTGENGRKPNEALSPENRQIGEGRQGAIVDVRSIIADYRLRHPETVPRRGRRMRNSLNVGLGAGGAMVETGHSVDSRPSSTDSCKSNPNTMDPTNNSMSFKDVLVQFAKLSQQQGEPVKTPQNYPDVTLHPVAPSPAPPNTSAQQSGSLLHGILTKSQSPRPTTFSPTLARLLTAPERERNAPSATTISQQSAATQHLLQAYQGSNPVSITDLLSSSKARTEITITPVVNTPVQSHSNNLIHVDDVEEETAVIEDRETRISAGGRDARDDRDSPPRCQGCHERAAQFVCAGCGNQWYCSRECQVAAWDEHSEVCSG